MASNRTINSMMHRKINKKWDMHDMTLVSRSEIWNRHKNAFYSLLMSSSWERSGLDSDFLLDGECLRAEKQFHYETIKARIKLQKKIKRNLMYEYNASRLARISIMRFFAFKICIFQGGSRSSYFYKFPCTFIKVGNLIWYA